LNNLDGTFSAMLRTPGSADLPLQVRVVRQH
jgi:hypothetical protein